MYGLASSSDSFSASGGLPIALIITQKPQHIVQGHIMRHMAVFMLDLWLSSNSFSSWLSAMVKETRLSSVAMVLPGQGGPSYSSFG